MTDSPLHTLNAWCCLSFKEIIKNNACVFSVDIACLTIVSIIFIYCRGNTLIDDVIVPTTAMILNSYIVAVFITRFSQ